MIGCFHIFVKGIFQVIDHLGWLDVMCLRAAIPYVESHLRTCGYATGFLRVKMRFSTEDENQNANVGSIWSGSNHVMLSCCQSFNGIELCCLLSLSLQGHKMS